MKKVCSDCYEGASLDSSKCNVKICLERLRDMGNSVLVVEHDEDIIKTADHIIDIGPAAGAHGGESGRGFRRGRAGAARRRHRHGNGARPAVAAGDLRRLRPLSAEGPGAPLGCCVDCSRPYRRSRPTTTINCCFSYRETRTSICQRRRRCAPPSRRRNGPAG